MKIVIFGLSISSSWGNGHATLWRGLCKSLSKRNHQIIFYEKDVSHYASHRDDHNPVGVDLRLYSSWEDISSVALEEVNSADVGMVTSYCPDAISATKLLRHSTVRLKVFYDLDTPVTLEKIEKGIGCSYIDSNGLTDFDLVLSYTGGVALEKLRTKLGAKVAKVLYGSVDPEIHRPQEKVPNFFSDLSYLGTYSADRQDSLNALFIEPAQHESKKRFLLAGSMYPANFSLNSNISYVSHLPPNEHSSFFSSSRLTLNLTRKPMAQMGYCPSGRIFEASACQTAVVSDYWVGLDHFYEIGTEILIAKHTRDIIRILNSNSERLERISKAARERTLSCHTSETRAVQLENIIDQAISGSSRKIKSFVRKNMSQNILGIIPAAGKGSRIQPLAFSKELLPIGVRTIIPNPDFKTHSHTSDSVGASMSPSMRPRAVSEFLLDRMVSGGANRVCIVVSPGKSDILEYFGGNYAKTNIFYTVQPKPLGLCDAIFKAKPFVSSTDIILIGLPDTVWFPEDGFELLDNKNLSLLLFPVDHPELFDSVSFDNDGWVKSVHVKSPSPPSSWIWGALKLPGKVYNQLYEIWDKRNRKDEYVGTLINAFLEDGGKARAVPSGTFYVDVGTVYGYQEAIQMLTKKAS